MRENAVVSVLVHGRLQDAFPKVEQLVLRVCALLHGMDLSGLPPTKALQSHQSTLFLIILSYQH